MPPDFAEWVLRSLDGTITPEQFAQLDHEIATNDKARAYYLEFIATYVGLVALVGGLPKPETLVGVECGIPEASGDLRVEPQTPSKRKSARSNVLRAGSLPSFLPSSSAGLE